MLIKQEIDNFWMLKWLDEFMTGHKGFICGGCFKNIFNREKVKDLDVFFKNRTDFDEAVQYFNKQSKGYDGEYKGNEIYQFYYETNNVKAYKHIEKGIVIELCCKIFGTAEEIVNNFDFTVTKFAYYKEEVADETGAENDDTLITSNTETGNHKKLQTHIEYKVLHDDKFFEHLHLKRLVTDNKILYPMSTFERMLRYAKYGYFPCRETKMKIIKSLRELSEQQVELSESLYEGVD